MNATRPFYSHEPDSSIMIKKDHLEIDSWTEDLEYITEELGYLLELEDRIFKNAQLYQQLHELKRENQLRLGQLYRYQGTIRNARECDTAECDAFYLYNHEKTRTNYRAHLKKYRTTKSNVFSKIVRRTK